MSAATEALPDARPRHRKRRWLLTTVAVLVAVGVAVVAIDAYRRADRHPASGTDNTAATSLATVTRRSLAAQTQVNGTLG